jgi:hypothetical protein
MGGQGNVTMLMATLALRNLTKYVMASCKMSMRRATITKDYCDNYESLLSSDVALVAGFLHPFFPVPHCPKYRAPVEELMAATYPNDSSDTVDKTP